MKPQPRDDNLNEHSSDAALIDASATVGEQMNQIEAMMQKHSINNANYDSDCDDFK